jgi:hypothetical protein
MVSGVSAVGGDHSAASTLRMRSHVNRSTDSITPGVSSHGSPVCGLASVGGMSHGSSLLNGGHRNFRFGKSRDLWCLGCLGRGRNFVRHLSIIATGFSFV